MRIVNWNIERQSPDTRRARIMMERVSALEPDVVCLTEAFEGSTDVLGGYEISTRGVAWSKEKVGERKVVLWSRHPWNEPDLGSSEALRSGAYVAATTQTPLGVMHIVGVCIPYSFASPLGMIPKARPWSQHLAFLEGLGHALGKDDTSPTILVGDFNQFIPRIWGSKAASAALQQTLGPLAICTSGIIDGVDRPTVDHIALSPNLLCRSIVGIDEHDETGRQLSDHFGLAADVSEKSSPAA